MRKLHLDKALDKRYQGLAGGVGAAWILGRIDKCPVFLGKKGVVVEFKLYFLVIFLLMVRG